MSKQIVNISDTVKTFQEKVNIISADLGWRGNLTTAEDSDVIGAINEHDAELGTITALAMGTTASTVSGAIAELDDRLDSANNTQINSPKLFMRDSAADNIIKGDLFVHSNVDVRGNLQVDGTLTVDGVVNFKAGSSGSVTLGDANTDNVVFNADVNSNIIPNTDNTYDLGTSSQEWRHLYIDGTANIDNVIADSATISSLKASNLTDNRVVIAGTAGKIEDDAKLTFNGTNLYVNATAQVTGEATLASATVSDLTNTRIVLAGTAGALQDNTNFTFNGTQLAVGLTNFTVQHATGNTLVAGTLGAGETTLSSATVSDLTNTRVVLAGTAGALQDNSKLTFNGTTLAVTGNVSVTGTVDGRDVSVDGTLLDTHDAELGTITSGAMGTIASTVSGAIAELDSDRDVAVTFLGTRSLNTIATDVTSGINELKTRVDLLDSGLGVSIDSAFSLIGPMGTLTTSAKNTLVSSINEVHALVDQTTDFTSKFSVTDAGGGGSLSYNNTTGVFTYTGPSTATTSDLGIIKIEDGTVQTTAANTVTTTASRTYGLQINASDQGVVNVPWTDTVYSLPAATTTVRGGIELEDDTVQSTAANTVTTTASRTYGLQVNAAAQGVINVPWTDTVYSLPEATATARGGIELFSNTDQSVAANTVTTTASRTYGIQLNSAGQAVVNVPWVDTNTDTIYSLPAATTTVRGGIELEDDTVQTTAANTVTTTASRTYGLQVNAAGQGVINVPWVDTNTDTVYSHPNHTGDVTSTGDGATTIAADVVNAAKLTSAVTLIIYNSAGTAVKTLYGAGS